MQCLGQCLIVSGALPYPSCPSPGGPSPSCSCVGGRQLLHSGQGGGSRVWVARHHFWLFINPRNNFRSARKGKKKKKKKMKERRKRKDFLAFHKSCLPLLSSSLILLCRREQCHLILASCWTHLLCPIGRTPQPRHWEKHLGGGGFVPGTAKTLGWGTWAKPGGGVRKRAQGWRC